MRKKLSIANGTYEKDGQTKTRWVSIGVLMEKDGKEFILLDPTINLAGFQREQGKDMIMVGVFAEDNQQNYGQQPQQGSYQQQAPQQQNNYQQQQSYNQPQQQHNNANPNPNYQQGQQGN